MEERPIEERRLMLAVVLSLLVLTAYRMLVPTPPVPSEARPTPPAAPAAAAEAPAPAPEAPPAPIQPTAADDRERRVEVHGPELSVAFTNRGARVVSWRLPRFQGADGRPEEMVLSLPSGPRPLDLDSGDEARDKRLREALFVASAEDLLLQGAAEATLTFKYRDAQLRAEKGLRFDPKGQLVSLWASVQEAGKELPVRILWGPGVGNPTPQEMEVRGYQAPHAVTLTRAGVERVAADKLGSGRRLAEAAWVGVESHYFVALLVPPGGPGNVELRAVSAAVAGEAAPYASPLVAVDAGRPAQPARLYVGPKDYPTLARLGHEFSQVVPVGEWIGPIVVMLMRLLRWVQSHVGNYGWSIVLLTVVINLVMSPFRHVSIANGMKMAKLSPEMKLIQERYRGIPALDKRREQMQKEMALLYEKHGMSMGGQMLVGCLPLLLTMPFLIAFYRVLDLSVELRGAHFLWLVDLSQKDPYFVTPVLMGLSMFLMQRMTPTAMDPQQQKMMMIMPLVLMVMFFAAPAGLNLYWLSSNLCSIVQQLVTLRIIGAQQAGSAAQRRRK